MSKNFFRNPPSECVQALVESTHPPSWRKRAGVKILGLIILFVSGASPHAATVSDVMKAMTDELNAYQDDGNHLIDVGTELQKTIDAIVTAQIRRALKANDTTLLGEAHRLSVAMSKMGAAFSSIATQPDLAQYMALDEKIYSLEIDIERRRLAGMDDSDQKHALTIAQQESRKMSERASEKSRLQIADKRRMAVGNEYVKQVNSQQRSSGRRSDEQVVDDMARAGLQEIQNIMNQDCSEQCLGYKDGRCAQMERKCH